MNGFNANHPGGSGQTKFEFNKYSTFDDTPKNLIVSADRGSGNVILWHQDSHTSEKALGEGEMNKGKKRVTKFLMNLMPRVVMVPSVSQESGPVLGYCLVKSPAPNILSTSVTLLVTLHRDGILRLWTTDDGRCVLSSRADLIPKFSQDTIPSLKAIKSNINALSGVVAIGCSEYKEVFFINVYKMTIVKKIALNMEGIKPESNISLHFKSRVLIIQDSSREFLQIWNRGDVDSNRSVADMQSNASSFTPQQQSVLDMANAEDLLLTQLLNFTFSQTIVGGNDKSMIAHHVNFDQLTLVSSDTISVYNLQTKIKKDIIKPLNKVIFGKFLKYFGVNYLLTVDEELDIIIYDYERPKVNERGELNAIVYHENLISSCHLFEEFTVKTEGMTTHNYLLEDPEEKRAEKIDCVQKTLKEMINMKNRKIFRFANDEYFLYSVIEMKQKDNFACWNLECLLNNIHGGLRNGHAAIPLSFQPLTVFPQITENPSNIINFQPILIKSFYNPNHYAFFFNDEQVTDSVIYLSQNHPSQIIGTNYGRIFIISMFQETDDKVEPILLVDSHHRSKITKLFVAYNSARKLPKGLSSRPGQPNLLENGGHLISVSEDGTIAVTNLNSGEIMQALHSFNHMKEDAIESSRIDAFFDQISSNRNQKRRNSFSGEFSVSNFFQMVKVKSQKVFHYATYGNVDKIIEIKNLNALSQQMMVRDRQGQSQASKTQSSSKTPEQKNEDHLAGMANMGIGSLDENLGYACVSSEGGTINILHLTNLQVDILQLSGLDTESEVLGIYSDTNLNLFYVLTQSVQEKKIGLYIYNSKSCFLLRRVDQRYALDILMIRDTLEQIVSHNEGMKLAAKGTSLFDFETFTTSFFHSGLSTGGLMGLGCHKLLDYLSLSLNLPLEYHPHTMLSTKYTKIMQDLLKVKSHIMNVIGGAKGYTQEEIQESQRVMIHAVNEAVYMNNSVYQSDFNQEYFMKQSGVTCISTQKSAFLGSKQHIIIANGKQVINILQDKMKKNSIQLHSMKQNPQPLSPQNQPLSKKLSSDTPNPSMGSSNDSPNQRQQVSNQDSSEFIMRIGNSQQQEEEKAGFRPPLPTLTQQRSINSNLPPLVQTKWPTRLLSLLQPFNVDVNLDDGLERFMGLNLPFIDFRIGVQGAQESFSFVVTREDEDFHSEKNNPTKIIRLLRLSQHKMTLLAGSGMLVMGRKINHETLSQINNEIETLLDSEPVVRFFGSEHWKISGYISTLLPSFFLSILAGLVDQAKDDVQQILQEWLFIMQRINQQRTITDACRLSIPAASKLLLKKDPSISATSIHLLIRPVLFALTGTDRLNDMVQESSAIIMDTYKRLKKEQTVRATYSGGSQQSNQSSANITNQTSSITVGGGGLMTQGGVSQQSSQQQQQQPSNQEKLLINNYFGELELRALICISFFAQYNNDQLDQNLRYRASKLTIILTRELVTKFNTDRRYVHLLTHLLQLLTTWLKTSSSQFNNKQMIGEVIQLLLFIFNINKASLSTQNVITRVTGENYYLIKPNHPELYLKLTAAKALLEIGETFTHDFLGVIHEEATHLNLGSEYQQNVLEILKIFINSSSTGVQEGAAHGGSVGVNLEHHLIQITAILLKCFDPNELALRKNSQKIVSVILSIMVKMFPMVAFHHESQRLAVGTHDGPIAIYDMRTSSKWKILEGHSGNITCLCFDSKGNMLASYSAVDRTLQLWKVGNTGFFSTIMGGTSKSSNKISLPPLPGVKNPHARKQQGNAADKNIMQENNRTGALVEDSAQQQPAGGSTSTTQHSGKRVNICLVKFVMPKEKEVELKREDGIVLAHKLVK